MGYLLITNAYPNKDKIYANAFIHRRVKGYLARGLDVTVVVFTTKIKRDEYFDGVKIMYMDEAQLYNHLLYYHYEKLLFHFINYKMFNAVERLKVKPNVIVWLHGFEAEAWYTRYYNYLSSPGSLKAQLQKKEHYYPVQKAFLKKLMTRQDMHVQFIYVSERFKTLYVDPFVGVEPENFEIIPNMIDADLFPYHEKTEEDRFHIVTIRPFTAKNYANDLTVKVIQQLAKKKYFKKLQFSIYGDGPLFEEITKPLQNKKNVNLNQMFIPQNEISSIHRENGIYLGPSRHDSQGVSINEAMSSGLVPISNEIGGIPNFIQQAVSGFLAPRNDVDEMVAYIDFLIQHPKVFLEMSRNASEMIQSITGSDVVLQKELEVITNGEY
ncbi:glycosyltransferase family 4 protein [Staphylococcus coagulans]|uniref:glycosyltransferase family 4 protein n=1 Tax=Staphylococcus coagulans TaxID=74706 RepID=UPI001BE9489F|nr:glycosyltransferase family 4 protein [Staphylococcus coagulans]MBT2813526.1 glycosyltransferase family 4 protein [Staphylococcus coagulans]MBT2815789.1 glycosyltransferase family 4 protein [Staphylococcus coagulans]MBT2836822.1 glycosyltransferase family 4 protein [Staphylococcus coagulans]MBT2841350.1 glycosyltransferase family 4 protein [Staphylococcus coagulans]MBT2847751.1 glycosyltransferase family 4 protein [Staphylococcus coagulans]